MTIKERIEKSKRTPRKPAIEGFIDGLEGRIYIFTKAELHELLKQVAREQRRYCAESGFDIETGKYTFEAIQTARSPLNEDSHE